MHQSTTSRIEYVGKVFGGGARQTSKSGFLERGASRYHPPPFIHVGGMGYLTSTITVIWTEQ